MIGHADGFQTQFRGVQGVFLNGAEGVAAEQGVGMGINFDFEQGICSSPANIQYI